MKQARILLNRFLVADLRKSSGEGSRGGKVIGHTRSGKPIYARLADCKAAAAQYTAKDHYDAHDWHDRLDSMYRASAGHALDAADTASEHISPALQEHLLAKHSQLWNRAERHGKISRWHYQRFAVGEDAQEKADEAAWADLQRRHGQAI